MARGWEVLRTGAMPGDDGQILVVDRSGGEDGRTTCVVPGRLVHQEGEPDLVRRLDRRDMENAFLFAAAGEMRDALALLLAWEAKVGGCGDPCWAEARQLVARLHRSPGPEGAS